MNRTIQMLAMAVAAVMITGVGFAKAPPRRGHKAPPPPPRAVHKAPRPAPPPPARHHHKHSVWGKGGRNFLPGFIGGVVGGVIADKVVTTPVVTTPVVTTPVVTAPVVVTPVTTTTVVTTPVYTTQTVWVEGRYVDQVQSNGVVVRVWQPGHYEQRQVLVQ